MPGLLWQDDSDHDGHDSRWANRFTRLRSFLPPLNFITLHYTYFIVMCIVSSIIFYCSSDPAWSISYTDSLFLVVSAMTEAGLNTVNLSQMTTWQQTMLFLLIILGSAIWVSIWTVLFRKHVFEKRFDDIVRAERMRRLNRTRTSTLGLPILQRFVSFRKAQTTALGEAGLPATGTKVPTPAAPASGPALLGAEVKQPALASGANAAENTKTEDVRPVSGRTRSLPAMEHPTLDPKPQSSSGDTSHVTTEEADPIPLTPGAGHIVFAETSHPNADANGNATSTGRAYEPRQRLTRRPPTGPATAAEEGKRAYNAGDAMHNFLTGRTVGRNAAFHDLTREEREHLGGCEYRAIKLLAVIVPLYFTLWQGLGCIALGAWINNNLPGPSLQNGINPWWLGIFNGASAFNNSGMSLLDANMVPFQQSYFVLIVMGLMILAGNTAYPIFLRLVIWSLSKLLTLLTEDEDFTDLKDTFHFILKYPRRVYTNLFPSRPTWWLLFMLILLNSTDWVAFELLNLGNPTVENIPAGSRALDGLFQALAVRSGGFYVVSITGLYIGLQILYVIMMYISVYPVVITMRHSNVYEERSLGIYSDDAESGAEFDLEDTAESSGVPFSSAPTTDGNGLPLQRHFSYTAATLGRALHRTFTWHGVGVQPPPHGGAGRFPQAGLHRTAESRINFISQQIHGQLAHDIWWLVLAVLIISTIETSNFLADPIDYSVFNVLFEVVSAYGCVGISVGLPNVAYSFSGGWHTASKLVLCAVMIRGRHRGLPVALDRAVRLPGEQLHRDEEEDYRIRRSMTSRRVSLDA